LMDEVDKVTRILIVEDGTEYLEFFRLFLAEGHEYLHAQSGHGALDQLDAEPVDLVVLDMRFERSSPSELMGDPDEVARDYFGGDLDRASRFLHDNQGTFVLAGLRDGGHDQPALFVHDMPGRKLENLKDLYGNVVAVPHFDARAIQEEIKAALLVTPR